MGTINILDKEVVDLIAAGEVVERPMSVVKELVENAIDAGAESVGIELIDGGLKSIKVTDNGSGIPAEDVRTAFKSHATSKIRTSDDLSSIMSLGFRGEALPSIAAVAKCEIVTKPAFQDMACKYAIEGGEEKSIDETGAPDGTTVTVRELFYNTPARKKFMKTPQTEAMAVRSLIEHIALSHPEVAFSLKYSGSEKIRTSGNGSIKDAVYQIYGREIATNLISADSDEEGFIVRGFIGKPQISRGNRTYENFFINGRFVESKLLSKAIEDGSKGYLMQHRFPFAVMYFDFPPEAVDANVHPDKMEVRFRDEQYVYAKLCALTSDLLSGAELIGREKAFGEEFLGKIKNDIRKTSPYEPKYNKAVYAPKREAPSAGFIKHDKVTYQQTTFFKDDKKPSAVHEDIPFLSSVAKKSHRIIGQVFGTYWLVEYGDELYMIDQHAAHEKVLFERLMKKYKEKKITSQMLRPPMVVSLRAKEEDGLKKYLEKLRELGFEIEYLGGREYSVGAVPSDIPNVNPRDMIVELSEDFDVSDPDKVPDVILAKTASMACKAAVKGNNVLTRAEAERLIDELMTLENPYFCPHGRPTIFAMSKDEIERKFKRKL